MPGEANFVGEPLFQIVAPEKFCHMLLKIRHDDLGHLGVRKTYDVCFAVFFPAKAEERCFQVY